MDHIVAKNVIKTYSSKENLDFYKNVGLWRSEKELITKYFPRKKATLLDLGCGGGRTTIPLAMMGYTITAVDIVPAMIDLTTRNLKMRKLRARVMVGDATQLPFNDNSFDYVLFSFNGYEAIPGKENRERALSQIWRVLKPGGIFIFTTNTTRYFQGKMPFFFIREAAKYYISHIFKFKNEYSHLSDFEYGDCFLQFKPPMYLHFSDPAKVKRALCELGFELLLSDFREVIEHTKKPNCTKDYFYVCKKA